MRAPMITAIYSTIANYRATVENSEDNHGDLAPEKKSKILETCAELEQWLTDMRQAQEHLPNFERPVLRCSDMVDKNLELANMVAELLEDSHGGQAEALKEVAAHSARGPASARGQASARSMGGGNERKTQLISYISQLQEKIAANGEFGAYVSDAERERLNAHLIGASVWASQTSGVPTVHYIEKLQELRSVGDVIEWRCDEDSMRNDWISAVSSTIANCRNAATNPGDRYEKISDEKLQKIMGACKELEDWLQSMDVAQRSLAKYERPVLLCADMERRNLELARMVGELLEESRGAAENTTNNNAQAGYGGGGQFQPPPRALPTAPADEYSIEDGPPPPPAQEQNAESMPAMRGTGHTPRHTPRGPAPQQQPARGGPSSQLSARTRGGPSAQLSARKEASARGGSARSAPPHQPAPPKGPADPGAGQLREAGAVARSIEDERLLELEALDAACEMIVDGDEAPMAGRQMGH